MVTTTALAEDGRAGTTYVRRPRYRWEAFDSADPEEQELYAGFRVKLRVDASAGDLQAMEDALKESEDRFWQVVRPRIVEWNALCADVNDVETPIPAPDDHEDNWQAIYALERPLVVWIAGMVRTAHLSAAVRDRLAVNRQESRRRALNPPATSDTEDPDNA